MIRSALNANADLFQVFPHGGRIRSLVVGATWVEFDPQGIDLFEIDVPTSSGEILFTNTATHPGLVAGAAVTPAHRALSRVRYPGTYTACFDRDAIDGPRFFFALVDGDPGETATLVIEEAAS